MSRILYIPNSHCQQRQLQKPNNLIYPVLMAMEATKRRNDGDEVYWDNGPYSLFEYHKLIIKPEGLPFLSLPHPDRVWTNAKEPRYQRNGNFKYLPATYIQSASGCWWGKCSFCVEKGKPYEVRPVEDVISEIEEIKSQGYKEVFDDSATFPTGEWLERFCRKMGEKKPNIVLGCNARMFNYDFELMVFAGFRMLLFGLESANQQSLDNINKGVKVEDIKYIIKAAKAGLEPHICVVFGWKWETDADAINTLQLVHQLLKKGYAKTAQASFIHQQGIEGNESQRHFIRDIYGIWKSPEFWFNKLRDVHNKDDLKYLWRQIKEGLCSIEN